MCDPTAQLPPYLPQGNGARFKGQKPCEWCGELFWWHPKYRLRFCSNSCKQQHRGGGARSVLTVALCARCLRPFVRRDAGKRCAGCRLLSGAEMRRAAHVARQRQAGKVVRGDRVSARCGECGVTFEQAVTTKRKEFCSPACARQRTNSLPSNKAAKARAKRRRRALKLSAPSERYDAIGIFERDGWRCQICGKAVRRSAKVPDFKAPTIDHIVPLAAGGADVRANVQCAHFLCNSLKSDGVAGNGEQLKLVG